MRILLVDDSRAVSAVMAARLTILGHEVTQAENGEQGVERFCCCPPDLVLMDVEMPVMNGFVAAERIRALEAKQDWAWTPIIFLTASDTPENLVTAIEAGGDDFIAKTVPETVLQAKMKAMARIAGLRKQLFEANHKLEALAHQDGLTGIYNRRYMDLRLDHQWEEAQLCGAPFGLLLIDVDNFKRYNDHYGHQAGDDCLRALAVAMAGVVERTIANGLSRDAFVARYGGEEFAVLLPRCAETDYLIVAEQLLEAVRQLAIPHVLNADWGIVTLSVGGAYVERAEGRLAMLFRNADANLYQAKRDGRNRAEVCAAPEAVAATGS
ncbi:MAG: diguanylate cyclase [Rhodocyclaceae bacterium]|nr:MAG: diguanylate cyclase [Rhodocyclaceae bacterium]